MNRRREPSGSGRPGPLDVLAAIRPSLRKRLPGGKLLSDLNPRFWTFRYGFRTAVRCIIPAYARYFLGCCIGGAKRPIGELRPPYPVLYHFTPEANAERILREGLLPGKNAVYLTDWTDARWLRRYRNIRESPVSVGFRIDAERLAASGHRIAIINKSHVFTTDFVPPDCLCLTELRVQGEA